MALITGSNVTAAQLLEVLRVALVANGWTLNKTATGVSFDNYTGNEIYVSKGGIYGAFRSRPLYSNATGVGVAAAQGFNGSLPWNQQPGWVNISGREDNNFRINSHAWTGSFRGAGNTALNYWIVIHTNPDAVWVIVEQMAGWYSYIGLGALAKIGSWSGGTFQTGSFTRDPVSTADAVFTVVSPNNDRVQTHRSPSGPLSYTSADNDNISGVYSNTVLANLEGSLEWLTFAHREKSRRGGSIIPARQEVNAHPGIPNYAIFAHHKNINNSYTGSSEFIGPILSPFGGVTPLLPWYVYGERGALASLQYKFSLLGTIDKIYFTNLTNIVPASQIEQAGSTYIVFPMFRKGIKQTGLSTLYSQEQQNGGVGNSGWALKID